MPVAKKNTPDKYIFGRPAKYDTKKLADHLLEWIQDERQWDMCKWLDEAGVDPILPSKWAEVDEYFGQAWRMAKNKLAARRNEMLAINELPLPIWSRYLHNYDVLHHNENETLKDKDAKRQAKAKAEAEKEMQANPELSGKLDKISDQIKQYQDARARKSKRIDRQS